MKITQLYLGHEMFANCYLIVDEATGDAAIVDPAWYTDDFQSILSENKANLKYILLTHGHFDHIFGVYGLKEATGAKVVIHGNDAGHLLDENKSLAKGNMPEPQKPVCADLLVNDGDIIKLGQSQVKVMHTPGHTMGGVCYILEVDRVIISGDTLFCLSAG